MKETLFRTMLDSPRGFSRGRSENHRPSRFASHRQPAYCRQNAAKLLLFALLAPCGLVAQEPHNLDMASVASLARSRSWASKQVHQDAQTADAFARHVASARWGQVDFKSQYPRFHDPLKVASPIPFNLQPVLGLKELSTLLAPQDNLHVDLEDGYPAFAGGKNHNAIKATREVSHASAEAASATEVADSASISDAAGLSKLSSPVSTICKRCN